MIGEVVIFCTFFNRMDFMNVASAHRTIIMFSNINIWIVLVFFPHIANHGFQVLIIFYIIFALLYQTVGYTKTSGKNDFNYKYLSSYFSALISFDNQKNNKALEFFESSKYLKKKHNNY